MKRFFTIVPKEHAAEMRARANDTAQALATGSGAEAVRLFHAWAAAARQLPGPHVMVANESVTSTKSAIPNGETLRSLAELLIPPTNAGEIAPALPPDVRAFFECAQRQGLHVAQWFEEAEA